MNRCLSYINFRLLNTLSLQNKQDPEVIVLFKALITIFIGCEPFIPKHIKDWPTIQRTIAHTSKFIQMITNYKKYAVPQVNLIQATKLLQDLPAPLSSRATNIQSIVYLLLDHYQSPFPTSFDEDSQLTKKFYENDDQPLSPIGRLLEQDSEVMSIKINTTPNETLKQSKTIRSRSPTTTSSGSKSRTLGRLSLQQRHQSLTKPFSKLQQRERAMTSSKPIQKQS